MTTLIGITAYKGNRGIVLASDLTGTSTNWRPDGDVAYKIRTQQENKKIHVSKSNEFAIAMTGVRDFMYLSFLNDCLEGKIDLKSQLEKGFFESLLKLNLERNEYRQLEGERINALLVATRFENQPKLYTCFPLGKVEQRPYVSVGSGSDHAYTHLGEQINQKQLAIPNHVSLEQAVDLAVGGLDEASKDIYTGGLDLVIVTGEKILSYGDRIKKALNGAKKTAIESVKKGLMEK